MYLMNEYELSKKIDKDANLFYELIIEMID